MLLVLCSKVNDPDSPVAVGMTNRLKGSCTSSGPSEGVRTSPTSGGCETAANC